MQPRLPKLPAWVQTFANIREDGSVYVDKFFLGLFIDGEKTADCGVESEEE